MSLSSVFKNLLFFKGNCILFIWFSVSCYHLWRCFYCKWQFNCHSGFRSWILFRTSSSSSPARGFPEASHIFYERWLWDTSKGPETFQRAIKLPDFIRYVKLHEKYCWRMINLPRPYYMGWFTNIYILGYILYISKIMWIWIDIISLIKNVVQFNS